METWFSRPIHSAIETKFTLNLEMVHFPRREKETNVKQSCQISEYPRMRMESRISIKLKLDCQRIY